MAIIITDECINCGACEVECPNNAIYEGGIAWSFSEGTNRSGMSKLLDGKEVDSDKELEPVEYDYYYIVPEKCTECIGFHEDPQCAAVCPVDCCVPNEDLVESSEELQKKKDYLHA
ncbi:MAG: 4Fe-4S dicluster domain-containing protein [Flavobacteriales bacterium]|jgi:ferredoxin|nr:4Fe-4S dicluster domain-containing protein [Flavobacteriales bacterium]